MIIDRSATTTLQINVGDVNDHPPVFETSGTGTSTATLSESAPVGSVVAQLRATDLDVGINAQVIESISLKIISLYHETTQNMRLNPSTNLGVPAMKVIYTGSKCRIL